MLVDRYLAALAPVLADAVLGRDILGRVRKVERLFGHSLLLDQEPFEPAFEKWRDFREAYGEFTVRGMTVNERLHTFSLTEDFDRAVEAQDTDAVESILKQLHVDDESIASTIRSITGDA